MMRGALFVPGDRPERFIKAFAAGADAVIVDFEDAVEESNKAQAREYLHQFLLEHPNHKPWVRINAAGHHQHADDVKWCAAHPGVAGMVIPKAETAEQLPSLEGMPLLLIIESAVGIKNLEELAAHPQVNRLTFGGLDLAADLGMDASSGSIQRLFDNLRFELLLQSRTSYLLPPLETVFADLSDDNGLKRRAAEASQAGYGGMLCVHPAQVNAVQAAFSPTPEQLAWARSVLELAPSNAGAFRFQGQMIDAPVLQRARRMLEALPAAYTQNDHERVSG